MQSLTVTHNFMRKLTKNIRSVYGADVPHTKVLELVANALGHQAGPLMNALKTSSSDNTLVDTEEPKKAGPVYREDVPFLTEYNIKSFGRGIRGAVSIGGLLALRWHISKAESNGSSKHCPILYDAAKTIEGRWTRLEEEHGEGALLVEESQTIQLCLSDKTPASRHFNKPHLIENSKRLREIKGQEWWNCEHHFELLAAKLQTDNCS